MKMIPLNKYSKITEVMPILCVDVLAQDAQGEYLLVKRLNQPKKDKWWVIGGRVLKGESLKEAVKRKVRQETGLEAKNIRLAGYFELLNAKNPFGRRSRYHTISVVFSAKINRSKAIKLDSQSAGYKFSKKLPDDFRVKSF